MTTGSLVVGSHALPEAPDLVSFVGDRGSVVWIHGDEGFVGHGEAVGVTVGTGPDRFERADAELRGIFAELAMEGSTPPIAMGSFTFDERTEGSVLRIPKATVVRRDHRGELLVVGEEADGRPLWLRGIAGNPTRTKVRYSDRSTSEIEWLDAVARATAAIGDGVEKVVLARDIGVWSEAPFDLQGIVGRLSLRFPQCFTFHIDGLVGASPELLVRKRGARVESLVLAGSVARGSDSAEDELRAKELFASSKDRDEHDFAVRSVVEVLDRFAPAVRVESEPHLLRLANVQHLATHVAATVEGEVSSLAIAGALHPTAAVCGTPRADALQFIRANEGLDRARYAGPVGWVDARGDGEWAIALRCAELDGSRGRLFAGAGVVAGSLPEMELEETRLKLRAMQSVLGD